MKILNRAERYTLFALYASIDVTRIIGTAVQNKALVQW